MDVFAVFLPYSGRIFTTKGGIGDIPIENICPLDRNLSVEKLFLSFFFSRFFKKKLSFFPGGLFSLRANICTYRIPDRYVGFLSFCSALLPKSTDEVAVRTTSQAASGMIHLMAVGIWIWGSSFLFPQALIPVNSGW